MSRFGQWLKSLFNTTAIPAVAQAAETPAPAPREIMPVQAKAPLNKVAVIGAGVMGSGIAAQLANAGIDVLLYDIPPKDPALDRRHGAKSAIARMLKATPQTDAMNAGFMNPKHAKRVTPCNIEDDVERLGEADWIIEVVPEILSIKHKNFAIFEKHRKPGSIVSSNTSTIPLEKLTEGFSDDFKKDFMITHFFNPPRFMPLLEMVAGPKTRPDAFETIRQLCDVNLGKKVVVAKDTPGFIGNRIGTFMIQRAINETMDRGMKIEEADAALGVSVGFPKDGVFGLMDIVGLDIAPKVTESLHASLAPDDKFHALVRKNPLLDSMIEEGRTGRKSASKEGFYRLSRDASGKKNREALDLTTGAYRPAEKPEFDSVKNGRKGLRAVFETDDVAGKFAWNVLRDTLSYAASLVPQVSEDLTAIDDGMKAGYNWKHGPMEMIDRMGNESETGTAYFARRLREDGLDVPPLLTAAAGRPLYRIESGTPEMMSLDGSYKPAPVKDGVIELAAVKRSGDPLFSNNSVSLWDIGDGVMCAELHGMKNALDPDTMGGLNEAVDMIEGSDGKFKSLVIYNDTPGTFAVGANLALAVRLMNTADWDMVDDVVAQGQETMQRLKFAPFPVVGAVGGVAVGGGCEILLHCDAVQAHAETYMGLVETGVGIIPGWGGCKEYLFRALDKIGPEKGPMPVVTTAFKAIMMPQLSMSDSAHNAKANLWLRPHDGITMNRDRLLADAKKHALTLVPGYQPPQPRTLQLPGPGGKAALRMALDDFYARGDMTWHDLRVAEALTNVLTGGDTNVSRTISETEMLRLEREQFIRLTKTAQTRARMAQMINTGKPLREPPLVQDVSIRDIRDSLPHHTPKARDFVAAPKAATAPANGNAPAAAMPDVTGMKPMDALITIMKGDGWMPASPVSGDMAATFNQAANEAKAATLARMQKNKGMAAMMPSAKIHAEILNGLGQSADKAKGKLADAANDEDRVRLQASIAVLSHYRDVTAKLSFK